MVYKVIIFSFIYGFFSSLFAGFNYIYKFSYHSILKCTHQWPKLVKIILPSKVSEFIFNKIFSLVCSLNKTRRYGPLRGPTSTSCGGLWPSVEAFFALRAKNPGKKKEILVSNLGYPKYSLYKTRQWTSVFNVFEVILLQ